ncbi:MAG: hypothetical protein PF505_02075 [Vallitaleaceae bacterium]|nr:hypothetical protein [Vallitaleaceae bacterium]
MIINPCIPKRWYEFSIQYIFEETTYILEVTNPENISQGEVSLTMDGIKLEDPIIHMVGGQGVKNVQIVMHR